MTNRMIRSVLVFDPDRCFGCHSCEISCKEENVLPVGINRIRVLAIGPKKVEKHLQMHFTVKLCLHCDNPLCVTTCPTTAIVKRADGVVTVDSTKCKGCLQCVKVCPYETLQFNPEKGIVEKCDLCAHRLDKGLKPSCVQHCPGKALSLIDIDETFRFTHRVAKKSSNVMILHSSVITK